MLKKIRATLLALPKAWRIVLLFLVTFLFILFVVLPIFYKLGELIYKDDWYPTKSTWLEPLLLVPSITLLWLLGKWLKLDEKK